MTTLTKPSQPRSIEVAQELGIVPFTPGWRADVANRRSESQVQREYLVALGEFEASPAGVRDSAEQAEATKRKHVENDRLTAAGCGHLIGVQLSKSSRGSWGLVRGNRVSALTRRECEVRGVVPGPANY